MAVRKVPSGPLVPRRKHGKYRVCPKHQDTILEPFGGDWHDDSMGWCPTCQKGVKAVTVTVW